VSIEVELYGIARARAGVSEVELEATTLEELLRALAAAHPALDGEVVCDGALADGWLVSLDGERFLDEPGTPLPADAKLLLISAQAGG
jgi:molybdopterin converting factor small subunit